MSVTPPSKKVEHEQAKLAHETIGKSFQMQDEPPCAQNQGGNQLITVPQRTKFNNTSFKSEGEVKASFEYYLQNPEWYKYFSSLHEDRKYKGDSQILKKFDAQFIKLLYGTSHKCPLCLQYCEDANLLRHMNAHCEKLT